MMLWTRPRWLNTHVKNISLVRTIGIICWQQSNKSSSSLSPTRNFQIVTRSVHWIIDIILITSLGSWRTLCITSILIWWTKNEQFVFARLGYKLLFFFFFYKLWILIFPPPFYHLFSCFISSRIIVFLWYSILWKIFVYNTNNKNNCYNLYFYCWDGNFLHYLKRTFRGCE